MKVVIFCGGLGMRLREYSESIPKPMVQIGGRPILWHIMKIYAHYGYNDFVICLGDKGEMIRDYFLSYETQNRDFTVTLGSGKVVVLGNHTEDGWQVTLAETGGKTMTGGRLKRIEKYIGLSTFMATYGDGVADIDLEALVDLHRQQKVLATVTSVRPPGRFGSLVTDENRVISFREKPEGNSWINGGFFVLSPSVIDYIDGDNTVWEGEPLERLAKEGQLATYKHEGFWQPMDTLRDKNHLETLWSSGTAPWKVWK